MGAVFVIYLRGDSEGQARALSLELVRLLGKDSVFMDVDSIGLGRDFRQVLQERLASCQVMLALIGPSWLDAKDPSGARRLDSPTDFVRQEIAAALKRNIPVIPVLLQDAQIPPPERLPDDLKDLSYRNGFELGHSTWESDVREMVKRLGLSASAPAEGAGARSVTTMPPAYAWAAPAWFSVPRRIAATVLVVIGAVGLLTYLYSGNQNGDEARAGITQSSQPSTPTALPTAGPAGTTPLPQSSPQMAALAASGLEFVWPGEDCWDIFRGEQFVAYQCGTKSQALEAGSYTIKGKHAAVFVPFTVNIGRAAPTRISRGGVFEFAWSGEDCWDIFRGADFVAYQCGTKKQALGAGTYTIKGKHAPIFTPFTVDIKDGSLTRVVMGGVFEFTWPGEDCWDIFRGDEYVAYQCGSKKQALGAGTYTIKGKHAPVFTPFPAAVKDGSSTRIAKGGTFTFQWPGNDCWDIFRGDEFVAYQCGAKKQALGAGTYTIKGKHAPVFNPFEIRIADGADVVKAP
jgi:hypothetical protein